MRNLLLIPFFILAIVLGARAQSPKLKGVIIDSADNSAVIGAVVQLINTRDSLNTPATTTDKNGAFQFDILANGAYKVLIFRSGYQKMQFITWIADAAKNLGIIKLRQNGSNITEVEIEGQIQGVKQKGDTIQYNAAAYKTNPDATVEDLFNKLPGVSVVNGAITAHGESVTQILVDGKPYFGGDITAALKNIPAEIIEKIEVYNRPSEQSLFTGIDDGQSIKTINIILKKNRRSGQFGRLLAGYGPDNHYTLGGNINLFNNNRRITIIANNNNINQQNFSSQNLGTGGLNKTNAGGLNYSDSIGKKMYITGSYSLGIVDNSTNSDLARNYFNLGNNNTLYNEMDQNHSYNLNNRFSLKLDYAIDSMNALTLQSSISNQNNNSTNIMTAENRTNSVLQSRTNTLDQSIGSNYSYNNSLLLKHKFLKRGRTISVNIYQNANNNSGSDTLNSRNHYYKNNDSITTFDQQSRLPSSGYSWSGNVAYTEPINKVSLIQLNYTPSISQNRIDKQTYIYDAVSHENIRMDSALSNTYNSSFITQRGGLSYLLQTKKMRFTTAINYQSVQLSGDELYPINYRLRREFNNYLPSALFNYKFSNNHNLNINYQTSTNLPGIQQLQNVINNSNPLLISTGNPDLVQPYTHTLGASYGIAVKKRGSGSGFFINVSGSTTANYITNSTVIASKDSVVQGNYLLRKGQQFSKPINIDGYKTINSNFTLSRPVNKLKSNFTLTGGIIYSTVPGLINGVSNFNNTLNFNSGLVIASNISENLDFTISSYPSYNIVNNTISTSPNNNYYLQTNSLKFNWIFWKGINFKTDISYRVYSGAGAGYNQNFMLWSGSIGKKLFKKQNGEIRLNVYDILNQNTSISHLVTNTYIQDRQTNTLGRFYMVSFLYSIRNFKGMQGRRPTGQRPTDGERGPRPDGERPQRPDGDNNNGF